jgi:acetyl-CoA acetyltransferase
VNSEGYLNCLGHPIGKTRSELVDEFWKQLRVKPGPSQVNNGKVGLRHNLGEETSVVSIFRRPQGRMFKNIVVAFDGAEGE